MAHAGQIRIIAGRWRSRKLKFPSVPGLRPTPDRVRETLFNWLQREIVGAHCLDLFAGSGALGFEAASRGAASVVQVERHRTACAAIRKNATLLEASNVELVEGDVDRYLQRDPPHQFDLVFLDPPFAERKWARCCEALEHRDWLADGAKIYLEMGSTDSIDGLPENWSIDKRKAGGGLVYLLYQRVNSKTDAA